MVCVVRYDEAFSMGLRPCGLEDYEAGKPRLMEGFSAQEGSDRRIFMINVGGSYMPYGGRDRGIDLDEEAIEDLIETPESLRSWLQVHG